MNTLFSIYKKIIKEITQEIQSDNRNPKKLLKDPVGIRVVDRRSDP